MHLNRQFCAAALLLSAMTEKTVIPSIRDKGTRDHPCIFQELQLVIALIIRFNIVGT